MGSATPRLLSGWEASFFRAKRYPAHTEHQNNATLRLWKELIGDRRPDRYTRDDAFAFQAALRRLPRSHGKGGHVHARTAIAAVIGSGKPLLSEKTIKRHFSLMKQLWKHIGPRNADATIFSGIEHKIEDCPRGTWDPASLDRLLRARWNPRGRPGNTISDETHAWMVAIGGYSGMRVEEIARLRVIDIDEIDGVQCFLIRQHHTIRQHRTASHTDGAGTTVADGDTSFAGDKKKVWKPKTKAGERAVPIHATLIAAGLLDLREKRRAAGEERLLQFDGDALGKIGAQYSREFSRHKTDLEIDSKIVFHSFRHNVATILGGKAVKQLWVDTFLGHRCAREGEPNRSVGLTVYVHGLEAHVLQQVADAVTYPEGLCPLLLLRRVRGEIPW